MAKKYSTAFALTEDPLSESSVWAAPSNTNLTRMKSANGRAIAKAVGAGAYDDSAAHLSGYGTDYELTCTLYKDPTLVNTATHECELLLRINDTATVTAQYECDFSFNGNVQFIRWFSNGGSQDFEFLSTLFGDESNGGEFVTGDQIRARAAGRLFILSCIVSGVEEVLGVYDSTVLTSGQPGIGGFFRVGDGADPTKFAFNDAQISDIFVEQELAADDFDRANENPLSGGGAWVSSTGVNPLQIISNQVAIVTGDSDSGMRNTSVSAGIDHYSEITIGSTPGGNDFGPSVCCMSNGDQYLVTGYNGTELFIFSRIGGVFDQKGVVAATYSSGDRIKLARFGDELRLYKNEGLILTVTDQVDLIGGTFGIFGFDSTFRIASWKGGKIVAEYDDVPGSGGTVYTKDALDTLTITDSLLSSAIRGRNNQDTSTVADSTISNAVRGRDGQEVLTTIDTSLQNMLRGIVATDVTELIDETIARFLRTALADDSAVVVDELISAAGRIIAAILSSSVVIGDQVFTQMERGVIATDVPSITDVVLTQLLRQRQSESLVEISDSVFNFRLLRITIQDALVTEDALNSLFVSGTAGQFDGSKIAIGYRRKPIVIDGYHIGG